MLFLKKKQETQDKLALPFTQAHHSNLKNTPKTLSYGGPSSISPRVSVRQENTKKMQMLVTLNEQVFPCSGTQAYSPYFRFLYMLFLDRTASSGHSKERCHLLWITQSAEDLTAVLLK